jgi:hypothetical protein
MCGLYVCLVCVWYVLGVGGIYVYLGQISFLSEMTLENMRRNVGCQTAPYWPAEITTWVTHKSQYAYLTADVPVLIFTKAGRYLRRIPTVSIERKTEDSLDFIYNRLYSGSKTQRISPG